MLFHCCNHLPWRRSARRRPRPVCTWVPTYKGCIHAFACTHSPCRLCGALQVREGSELLSERSSVEGKKLANVGHARGIIVRLAKRHVQHAAMRGAWTHVCSSSVPAE